MQRIFFLIPYINQILFRFRLYFNVLPKFSFMIGKKKKKKKPKIDLRISETLIAKFEASKMSPQQFIAKREIIAGNALCPPPLKINKDSHFIRKSSSPPPPNSSPSSPSLLINGGAGTTKPSPQRHPVIIYTQSPKIIHTHPRDFMALVQKLTGLSRSDDEPSPKAMKSGEENKMSKTVMCDDNESSFFVTKENCCGVVDEGQVNSCFAPPPPPQLANSYLSSIPVYRPNSTDQFFCSNQTFFNYGDSLFFGAPNIHSISSASANSTLNGMNDFCDYNEY